MDLYFTETVKAEGDWFSPEDGTTLDLKSCYNVDLSEIFSKLVIAAEGLTLAQKEIFNVLDVIKSYTEEMKHHRKKIIYFSKEGAMITDYDVCFLRCDFSGCKAAFILEIDSDSDENTHIVITLKKIDLCKHNKARFITFELMPLCKRINPNVDSIMYFYAEETDEEKRFVKDEEYCVVNFECFTRNVLITADSLSAITIDVLNKI